MRAVHLLRVVVFAFADISVKGTKVSSFFRLKDAIDEKHTSGFIYRFKCNRQTCKSRYTGETGRRKEIREREHGYTDKQSAIFQHCESTKHAKARSKNFTVVARNYPQWRRRKICEAMYIRDENRDLNKQEDKHRQSYKLLTNSYNIIILELVPFKKEQSLEDYLSD